MIRATMRATTLALSMSLAACATKETAPMATWPTLDGKPPIVVAHRGASGYLPEHTLEAYALAIDQGADVVEPDLVFAKDGVLVARHDRYLSTTTDVADRPEFAGRKRANNDPNDAAREDWWVEDFTLAELKTLRAKQPFPGRSKEFDGLYEIPTFEEMLALVSTKAKEAGRPVGVYPETKHPAFFASIGHNFETPLLEALASFDAGPVFIQSFEPEILKRLKGKTSAKLVQLVDANASGEPNIPLVEIATYADGVGPAKDLVMNYAGDTRFVVGAHELRLFVHSWTFRNDQENPALRRFIEARYVVGGPPLVFDDPLSPEFELEVYFRARIDGVFTDFPDTAVKARGAIAKQ